MTSHDGGWRTRLIPLGVAVVVLVSWEVSTRTGVTSQTFFPAPTSVVATLVRELRGDLMHHLASTLARVIAGLLLGAGVGVLLGFAMGMSAPLRMAVDPMLSALHPVPKLAVLPLLMLVFGIGESPRVLVIAAASFFPMLLNTVAGVRHISPAHFDTARSYGASARQLLIRVVVPGSVPLVLTGLRVAANIAFLTAIAVEMVGSTTGLGAQLWLSWQTLRVDLLFAVLVLIAGMGVAISASLHWLARHAAPWLSGTAAHV